MLQFAAYLTIIIYNPSLVSLALARIVRYTTKWFYSTGHCHYDYPEWIFTFGNTANMKSAYYSPTPHPSQYRPLGLIAQDYSLDNTYNIF